MTNFDNAMKDLQEQINNDTREKLGDEIFDMWRDPSFRERPLGTNGESFVKGVCGDTMEHFLHIENGNVKEAGFNTDGCASSQACGSMAAKLAHNKACDELLSITGEIILAHLGKLPSEDEHCAWLAANSLHEALGNYYQKQIKAEK